MTQQDTPTKKYVRIRFRGEALKVIRLLAIKSAKHYNLTSTLNLVQGARNEENRSRSRHNVEGFFCRCTIFRLAKPAFFRYNENFTLVRDFYVAYFVIPK